MQKKARQKRLILALSLLTVLLVAIAAVALLRVIMPGSDDPYTIQETTSEEDAAEETDTLEPSEDTPTTNETTDSNPASAIDPATVSTVDIAPLEITVSYVKGIGGFEYEVLRTPSGTRYVEFRSAELIGTKCTNDQGTFASILVNPGENASATITKTITVEDTPYGLALPDSACTASADALKQYQQSFSDAFSLLKKIN